MLSSSEIKLTLSLLLLRVIIISYVYNARLRMNAVVLQETKWRGDAGGINTCFPRSL